MSLNVALIACVLFSGIRTNPPKTPPGLEDYVVNKVCIYNLGAPISPRQSDSPIHSSYDSSTLLFCSISSTSHLYDHSNLENVQNFLIEHFPEFPPSSSAIDIGPSSGAIDIGHQHKKRFHQGPCQRTHEHDEENSASVSRSLGAKP